MEESNNDELIVPTPAPWKLKGTVYMLSFWTSKASATDVKANLQNERQDGLPSITYSPLEAKSPFADPAASGEHFGGLSQFQIIRYTESPLGPYDELIICPGFFAYEKDDPKGKRKKMKNPRITRIYVSRKSTCWNGRKSESSSLECVQHLAHQVYLDCFNIWQTGISQNISHVLNGMNRPTERRESEYILMILRCRVTVATKLNRGRVTSSFSKRLSNLYGGRHPSP